MPAAGMAVEYPRFLFETDAREWGERSSA